MKNAPTRLRLDPDVESEVRAIAAATGLSQVEIIRQMVRAGIGAIKANNYELRLPLRLKVAEPEKQNPVSYPEHEGQYMRTEDKPSSATGTPSKVQRAVKRGLERIAAAAHPKAPK